MRHGSISLQGAVGSGVSVLLVDPLTGLEKGQLKQAIGNPATKLPKDLKPPDAWKNEAIEKQIETRNKEQKKIKCVCNTAGGH